MLNIFGDIKCVMHLLNQSAQFRRVAMVLPLIDEKPVTVGSH